jgi:hypothetical protein
MYPDSKTEQLALAKIEGFQVMGSNELPVYDLGKPRRAGAISPEMIEQTVLAAAVAAGIGIFIAVIWWLAG